MNIFKRTCVTESSIKINPTEECSLLKYTRRAKQKHWQNVYVFLPFIRYIVRSVLSVSFFTILNVTMNDEDHCAYLTF